MTIIDCLLYASDSLSRDVSWEYIAKLLVVWLYCIGDQERFRLALQYSLARAISVWLFE